MSATVQMSRMFAVKHRGDAIPDAVHDRLSEERRRVLDAADWTWEVETIPLDQITRDGFEPEENAARQQHFYAEARASLAFGEAKPLVTITDDHALLDGHATYERLEDVGATQAVVYHGTPE